jgi:hypothetical protein
VGYLFGELSKAGIYSYLYGRLNGKTVPQPTGGTQQLALKKNLSSANEFLN